MRLGPGLRARVGVVLELERVQKTEVGQVPKLEMDAEQTLELGLGQGQVLWPHARMEVEQKLGQWSEQVTKLEMEQ
jgi:hypothetical protein